MIYARVTNGVIWAIRTTDYSINQNTTSAQIVAGDVVNYFARQISFDKNSVSIIVGYDVLTHGSRASKVTKVDPGAILIQQVAVDIGAANAVAVDSRDGA